MKRARWMIIAPLLVASLIAGCAQTGQVPPASSSPVIDRILSRGEVKVGMSGDMPPMNLLTKEEKIIGLDADLATLIAEAMGVKLSIQKMPFADLLTRTDGAPHCNETLQGRPRHSRDNSFRRE